MFHVLVLGGMALVGCGGSSGAQASQGASDAAARGTDDGGLADVATPFDASLGLLDGSGSIDVNPELDALAQDAGGDSGAYADAALGQRETGVPTEAPQ
jgi:hypothetical protein